MVNSISLKKTPDLVEGVKAGDSSLKTLCRLQLKTVPQFQLKTGPVVRQISLNK